MKVALDKKLKKQKNFLQEFCCKYNFFEYKVIGNEKRCFPVRTKGRFLHAVRNNYQKNFNNTQFIHHIAGQKTLGYTNNPYNKYHLLMIDPDVKPNDKNPEITVAKAKLIIEKYLGGQIYWEKSFSYKNWNGYIIVEKGGCVEAFNEFVEKLQTILTNLCPDLKAVEILGRPNLYEYDKNIIKNVVMQTPAKLPRLDGIGENLENTLRLTSTDLYELTKDVKIKEIDKSANYRGITNVINEFTTNMLNIFGEKVVLEQATKRRVFASHLAVTLAIFYLCLQSKNDKGISYELVEVHWNNLIKLGITDLRFDRNIFSFCKKYAIMNNLISYTEQRYCFDPEGEEKGCAPKYAMNEELRRECRRIRSQRGGMRSSILKSCLSYPKNHNVYAILDFSLKDFSKKSCRFAA